MTVTGMHSVLVGDGNQPRVEERLSCLGNAAVDAEFGEAAAAVDRAIALITYGPTCR